MLLLALLLAAPPQNLASLAEPGLRAIQGDVLSAHIRFLADDALEGRGTASRGHAIAARYVATQLQARGFKPAGDKGSWFQTVPLAGMTVEGAKCALELDGAPLAFEKEVLYVPRAASALDDVTGELVFAGYGITAKDLGYDDVPADLKGKIAVVLYGAPKFADTSARAVASDMVEKSRRLRDRGALGMIVVFTPEIMKHLPWPFFVRNAGFEKMVWMDGDKPGRGLALAEATLPAEALARLVAKAGADANKLFEDGAAGKVKPFPLGIRAHLKVAATVRRMTSENVVGILPGDTDEVVVMSAHLDHLGIGPAVNGDQIYNGALDDAGGVASVLEQARAFATLPKRPRRSILALLVTAEEKGLVGSDYFANHPTVPLQKIVADVNNDGPHGMWQPHDLIPLGAEHSTILADVQAATSALGMTISPDPQPEQVFFIRSDQYNFVRKGIPAVFPNTGQKDAQGNTAENRQKEEWWTKNRYHQPSDEWDPNLDYAAMAKEVQASFLITLAIALDPDRPRWSSGDIFERLYGWNGGGGARPGSQVAP